MKKIKFNGIIERWQNKRKMKKALNTLQDNGYFIKNVYDIGANSGKWTRDMSKVLPNANFFMFEANETHRHDLSRRGHPFFIEILASEEIEKKFFSIGGTGDSLYLENTQFYCENDYRWVKTRTLDKIIEENNLEKPNFIKLDVQGAELDILKGAEHSLEQCHLICMECPILEYNIGAPTFNDYVEFMGAIGFTPLQILEQHLVNSELVQFDIIFIKKSTKNNIIGH